MDVLIHVLIILALALLFFLYRYQDSQNPMLFVILLCVFGVIFLSQDNTYITIGFNTTAEYNYTAGIATSETYPIQTDFPYDWMLYLTYLAFFLLAIINLTTGEEYNKKK